MQVLGSTLQHPTDCWKHKLWKKKEKKAIVPIENNWGLFFLFNAKYKTEKKNIIEGSEGILTFIVQVIRSFF